MAAPVVNYVLSPFEGNINPGYPQGLKLYLQETKDIDKESEKLDISVSNTKDVIYHFFSLANKYVWGNLAFMIYTGVGKNNIFSQVEHIQMVDMHTQEFEYFVLKGIVNVNQALPDPMVVSEIKT